MSSLINVADITGTHGLKGALLIYSHTRPAQAVAGYGHFWIGNNEEEAAKQASIPVVRCWHHGRRMLLQLDGIHDIQEAALLTRNKLWIKRDDIHVDDDEYLWDDLIGMSVFDDASEKTLGIVREVQDFGAQDTLLIEADDGEWMIPFVESIVTNINEAIHVHLPEGMDVCFTPKS